MSVVATACPTHDGARLGVGSSGIRPMTARSRSWTLHDIETTQERSVARYIDIHSGSLGATPEQFRSAHRRRLTIGTTEGVHLERAWLDPESGRAFCLSTAPSREAVLRVHDRSGQPGAEVYEVPVEVP
jgi:hypothetical protein